MNEESIESSKAPLIDHFIELRRRVLELNQVPDRN